MSMPPPFLNHVWYCALSAKALVKNQLLAKTIAGCRLVFGLDDMGNPFALKDMCPHRGMPLSYGNFDGNEIECCYHGWRFNCAGTCTKIPSLVESQSVDPSRIQVPRFACRIQQGNVWVYLSDQTENTETLVQLPALQQHRPKLTGTKIFPCALDHAVIGLMDPAHGPYVHRSWWWRSLKSQHTKVKGFVPAPFGFAMTRHTPSKNAGAYKLLGDGVSTEIRFQLPGVRIEHIKLGRYQIIGLTTVTPIDEYKTEVTQNFYWDCPWLSVLKPVLRYFMNTFLQQDYEAVKKQQEGLQGDPKLMLINDADKQAKWYLALKKEFHRACMEGRPFNNPVEAMDLQWTS